MSLDLYQLALCSIYIASVANGLSAGTLLYRHLARQKKAAQTPDNKAREHRQGYFQREKEIYSDITLKTEQEQLSFSIKDPDGNNKNIAINQLLKMLDQPYKCR